MKKLAFALPYLLCAAVSAGPIVNIRGDLYEIEMLAAAPYQVRSTLESQVWFGDSVLAQALSNEIRDSFGTPNYGLYGPMFTYSYYDGPLADYATGYVYYANRYGNALDNRAQVNNAAAGNGYYFAVGTVVGRAEIPEPGVLWLAALGILMLFGSARLKRPQAAPKQMG